MKWGHRHRMFDAPDGTNAVHSSEMGFKDHRSDARGVNCGSYSCYRTDDRHVVQLHHRYRWHEASISTYAVHCVDWDESGGPTCRTPRGDGEDPPSVMVGQSPVARRNFAVALENYEAFDTLLTRSDDLSLCRRRELWHWLSLCTVSQGSKAPHIEKFRNFEVSETIFAIPNIFVRGAYSGLTKLVSGVVNALLRR